MKNFMVCILTVVLLLLSEGIGVGEFKLKLVRADQAVADIPIVTEKDMLDDPIFRRRTLCGVDNDIKIQYIRRIGSEISIEQIVCDYQGKNWMVLTSSGDVYTVGGTYYAGAYGGGELGDGTCNYGVDLTDTRTVDYYNKIVFIDMWEGKVLALNEQGQLLWWGDHGLYGTNTLGYRTYPTGPPPYTYHDEVLPWRACEPDEGITNIEFTSVSIGYWCAAGIDTDGKLWTWGYGGTGTLGQGLGDTWYRYPTPGEVVHPEEKTWIQVDVGHSCMAAIDSEGQLWVWGDNGYGQLGLGILFPNNWYDTPQKLSEEINWTKVVYGEKQAVALNSDGELWSWGLNYEGSMAYNPPGDYEYVDEVIKISGDHVFTDFSHGFYHIIAVKEDGSTYAVGYDGYYGVLGLGDSIGSIYDWTQITEGDCVQFVSVYSNYQVTIGVGLDGNSYIWGRFSCADPWVYYYPTRWQLPYQDE